MSQTGSRSHGRPCPPALPALSLPRPLPGGAGRGLGWQVRCRHHHVYPLDCHRVFAPHSGSLGPRATALTQFSEKERAETQEHPVCEDGTGAPRSEPFIPTLILHLNSSQHQGRKAEGSGEQIQPNSSLKSRSQGGRVIGLGPCGGSHQKGEPGRRASIPSLPPPHHLLSQERTGQDGRSCGR